MEDQAMTNASRAIMKLVICVFTVFSSAVQAASLADLLNNTSGRWEIPVLPVTDGGCDGSDDNLCSAFALGSPTGITLPSQGGLVDNGQIVATTRETGVFGDELV
jgi:hypothetical protein